MSVYRDTDASVYFEHPYIGDLTATVYRNGVQLVADLPVTKSAPGKFVLDLTYNETQLDGRLDIDWIGTGGFRRTTSVNVTSPLISISELKTVFTDSHLGDGDLKDLEETVRTYIESYTQQTFGYDIGTYSVVGNGEKKIALPKRLLKLNTVIGGPVGWFTASNNGWYLYLSDKNYLTTKEMPPEEFENNTTMTQGVIYVPDAYWKKFRVGTKYTIDGEWGYYTVPDDVRQAALLLAKDFGTGENLYRDRYLDNIKAGDWNFKFTSGAYRGTGNARADQLLEPYRRQTMVII